MIQLRDVIHYFIGQKCFYDDPYYNSFGILGKITTRIILEVREPNLSGAVTNVKPLLRPLSSMNQSDWDIMKSEFTIDITSAYSLPRTYSDKPWHVLILENRLQTNTLSFNDGLVLLKHGYDLFSLIESGQAKPLTP